MSRRPGHGAQTHQTDRDDRPAGTEAEAAAATTAIAGLRWRLRRQGTLEHPAVRRELRKLEEQLAAQLERAERTPGRHRAPADGISSRPDARHGDDTGQSGLPAPAPVLQLLPGS